MSAADIEDIAVNWVVRMDRSALLEGERAEMEAWLDADPRHRGAFVRAQAAWAHLDRAKALGGGHLVSYPATARRRATRRSIILGGAGAAAAAAAAAGFAIWPRATDYQTGRGEIRRIVLSDGSVAVMNGNSALSVTMGRSSRRVRLSGSEAWFQVAHDPNRPFIVETPNLVARAVGTAFSVVLSAGGGSVLTTEGTVAVKPVGRGDELLAPAGARAVLHQTGAIEVEQVGVQALDRQLAWRTYQVALEDEPLRQAADQFNRYNARKLVIDSPAIAEARVVGWFKLDDPDGFARAVAATLGGQVISGPTEIRISAAD